MTSQVKIKHCLGLVYTLNHCQVIVWDYKKAVYISFRLPISLWDSDFVVYSWNALWKFGVRWRQQFFMNDLDNTIVPQLHSSVYILVNLTAICLSFVHLLQRYRWHESCTLKIFGYILSHVYLDRWTTQPLLDYKTHCFSNITAHINILSDYCKSGVFQTQQITQPPDSWQ